MFGLFKKKTEVEKLQKKYELLMKEYHKFSTIDRSKSDKKYAEAQEVADSIEKLQQ